MEDKYLTIGDIGDFTLEELGDLTLGELSLPIDELLTSLRDRNAVIPVNVYEHLRTLYADVEACYDKNVTPETPLPKMSDMLLRFSDLINFVANLKSVYELVTDKNLRIAIFNFIKFICGNIS